jgi:hypothetical protein
VRLSAAILTFATLVFPNCVLAHNFPSSGVTDAYMEGVEDRRDSLSSSPGLSDKEKNQIQAVVSTNYTPRLPSRPVYGIRQLRMHAAFMTRAGGRSGHGGVVLDRSQQPPEIIPFLAIQLFVAIPFSCSL